MKTYSPKEELIRVLNGKKINYFPRGIPVFGPVVDMMKATGAYFPDANYIAEPMAKLAIAAHELGGWNAIMMPWASTIEMEALGCEVTIKKDNIADYPLWKKSVFKDAYDVKFGKDILKKGSFPAILKATKIVRDFIERKYNGDIPIISMFQGPFTIASYSIGFNKMFKYMIKDIKRAQKALDVISDLNILYANEMLKCGGDLVLLSDPVAEGLGSHEFKNTLLPVFKKITNAIKESKMIHICGKTSRIIKHLPESGFYGYSFDYPKLSIEFVKQSVGAKMKVIGSVPTITHLLDGTKEDVFKSSLYMIENGVDILAPSCGLPQYTPLQNVKAMAEAIEYWNKKRYGITF